MMMLSVVLLSAVVSLGSAASCKSITIFGEAYIPISYCFEVSFLGFAASTQYVCDDSSPSGVVSNEYSGSGCKSSNLQNSTAYVIDDLDVIGVDCSTNSKCKPTEFEAASCNSCKNNKCEKNGLINIEFGIVTGQCINIPDSYLEDINTALVAQGESKTDTVALQFECNEEEGIGLVAYDDPDCSEKSDDVDQARFKDLESEAEEEEGEEEDFVPGCSANCDGVNDAWDCTYVVFKCGANQIQIFVAVFIAIFSAITV